MIIIRYSQANFHPRVSLTLQRIAWTGRVAENDLHRIRAIGPRLVANIISSGIPPLDPESSAPVFMGNVPRFQ
jgi:hypothetical protein